MMDSEELHEEARRVIAMLRNRITALESENARLRALLYEWLGQQKSGNALAVDTEKMMKEPK